MRKSNMLHHKSSFLDHIIIRMPIYKEYLNHTSGLTLLTPGLVYVCSNTHLIVKKLLLRLTLKLKAVNIGGLFLASLRVVIIGLSKMAKRHNIHWIIGVGRLRALRVKWRESGVKRRGC